MRGVLFTALFLSTLSLQAAQTFSKEVPETLKTLHKILCENPNEDAVFETEIFSLQENTELYLVQCELYAYNSSANAYIVTKGFDDSKFVSPVSVPALNANKTFYATTTLMGGNYDPETKTLATFSKGRGVGDCGQAGNYKWVEGEFVLSKYFLKEKCDGRSVDWPQIYPFKK